MINYHRTLLSMALMGFAALLLALPATANADRGDRRERAEEVRDEGRQWQDAHRHQDSRRHEEARAEENRDRHARNRHDHEREWRQLAQRWSHRRHARRHDARHVNHSRHEDPYYCEPCRNRFTSRDRFRRHLRHGHRVPAWRLSRAIVKHRLGWVFYG